MLRFSSLLKAFNALDDPAHKMHDWNKIRSGHLVAKVTFCSNYDKAVIPGTWVPLDLAVTTEVEFVQKLHSFVSAYPDNTHLCYSGAEEITYDAFFFVMYMTTTFVPTLFIQQVVLPLRGHASDEVYLRCLSALKAHPGLTTGQYLAVIMATLLFNQPPTWPERLATWAASNYDLGCPPGYIAGLVRELVNFRDSEPSWMTVPRAIHQGDAAEK